MMRPNTSPSFFIVRGRYSPVEATSTAYLLNDVRHRPKGCLLIPKYKS